MKKKNMLKNKINVTLVMILVSFTVIFPISGFSETASEIQNELRDDTTSLSVIPSNQTVDFNETFSITIHLNPGEPVVGIQFDLSFDPTLVQVDSVANADPAVWSFFQTGFINNTAGTINASAVAALGFTVTDPTDCVEITFTAQSKPGTSPLDLFNVEVGDPNAEPVDPLIINSGEVTIRTETSLSVMPFSQTVDFGETFSITIELNQSEPVQGVEIGLSFDPDLIQAESVINGNSDVWMYLAGSINNTAGEISGYGVFVLGYSVPDPITCFEITFTSLNDEGKSPLNFTYVIVNNEAGAGQVENLLLIDGEVLIVDDYSPDPSPGPGPSPVTPANQPPVAIATVDKNTGVPGEIFTYNASESYDPDGEIVTYMWDFGDGLVTSIDEPLITHSFAEAGSYEVMLTVEDNQGATGSLDEPIIIEILRANIPPEIIEVIPETTWTHKQTNVSFTMNAFDPDVNDTLRFEIEWGDGEEFISDHIYESNETFTTSHQWNSYGVYQVNVTVFDEYNASSETITTLMYVDVVVLDEINGWLIDRDSDGTFDVFKDLVTEVETVVEEQADGSYLIDSTDDGNWDHTYCEIDGLQEYEKEVPDETPGFPLFLMLISLLVGFIVFICFIVWKKQKRKK